MRLRPRVINLLTLLALSACSLVTSFDDFVGPEVLTPFPGGPEDASVADSGAPDAAPIEPAPADAEVE